MHWALWWSGLAAAGNPSVLLELDTVVRAGPGGNTGEDRALDVTIDATGHTIAVGVVDGLAGHGTDGYIVVLENEDASVLWDLTVDSGAVGPDRADSDEWIAAIARPPFNEIAYCGRLGGTGLKGAPVGLYWVVATEPNTYGIHYPPGDDWSAALEDDAGTAEQSCTAIQRVGASLVTVGDSAVPPDAGGGLGFRFDAATGSADPLIAVQEGRSPDERLHGVAVDPASGAMVVVGSARNQAGDRDGLVRAYDGAGSLRWSADLAGDVGLDDEALGVAWDVASGTVVVVGFTNQGADEGAASDRDWVVQAYEAAGDGKGGSALRWSTPLGVASGFDDVATSVVFDDDGDPWAAGGVGEDTGERWLVVGYAAADGQEAGRWIGPVQPGDSRILGMALRDGKLALGGYVHDGTSRDFAVTVLDHDDDGDGVPNSVDQCPTDPDKVVLGTCGCFVPEVDRDGDTAPDCVDQCPDDPDKAAEPGRCGCGQPDADADRDGILDCFDACPADPDKVDEGLCGCGAADADLDQDGVVDCNDDCLSGPGDCPPTPGSSGCGCHPPTGAPMGLGMVMGLGLLAGRRRREPPGAERPGHRGVRRP